MHGSVLAGVLLSTTELPGAEGAWICSRWGAPVNNRAPWSRGCVDLFSLGCSCQQHSSLEQRVRGSVLAGVLLSTTELPGAEGAWICSRWGAPVNNIAPWSRGCVDPFSLGCSCQQQSSLEQRVRGSVLAGVLLSTTELPGAEGAWVSTKVLLSTT